MVFTLLILSGFVQAQSPEDGGEALFHYGNDSVTISEFQYVFQKNSANNPELSREEVENYLELYINFKLKVKEAEELQIDTIPSVLKELYSYRDQLRSSYIDKEILDGLIDEAFERTLIDVRASHIMVGVNNDAKPEDSLTAYRTIMNARERILQGEEFGQVARDVSTDPSAESNGGDLGYFTAFQIPFYKFETVAYTLPIGKVSLPVRTSYGYHLLKVADRRPARGRIQVRHILLKHEEERTEEGDKALKAQIDSIYQLLLGGASFEDLAKEFSQDPSSTQQGGLLPYFGVGRMVRAFEDAAFALEEDGQMSPPIETSFGWHIIKRVHHAPVKASLDNANDEIKSKVIKDSRYKDAQQILLDSYKKEYGLVEFTDRLDPIAAIMDSSIYEGKWKPDNINAFKQILFMIEEDNYYQADLLKYLADNQKKIRFGSFAFILGEHYKRYLKQSVLEYGLVERYDEFRHLRQEYREGILLFELTEETVWNKAIEDSAALAEYYEANKTDHMWEQRVNAKIYNITDEKAVKKVKKWARKKSDDEIRERLNVDSLYPTITISRGLYEKGADSRLDHIEWTPGWYDKLMEVNNSTLLVWVIDTLEPAPKSLDEAKGFFIADYQDFLERAWIEELREKYPVKVNYSVLDAIFEEH